MFVMQNKRRFSGIHSFQCLIIGRNIMTYENPLHLELTINPPGGSDYVMTFIFKKIKKCALASDLLMFILFKMVFLQYEKFVL